MQDLQGIRLSITESAFVNALRAIPVGTMGKTRIAKRLLASILAKRDLEVELSDGLRVLLPSMREPVGLHCLIDGIYEPKIKALMKEMLPHGGTFVDIGANIGVLALAASRIVGEQGRVVAFEASPSVNPYLAHNIALNSCINVLHVPYAASDKDDGDLKFWAPPVDHFGMGALAPQFDVQPIAVKARTIDRVLSNSRISKVHLMKLDVEGFEYAALRGASNLLRGLNRPPIIMEFSDWAEARTDVKVGSAQRFLLDRGYRLYDWNDKNRRRLDAPIETGTTNIFAEPC